MRAPINVFMIAPHESIKSWDHLISGWPSGSRRTLRIAERPQRVIVHRPKAVDREIVPTAAMIDPAPDFRRIGFVHLPGFGDHELVEVLAADGMQSHEGAGRDAQVFRAPRSRA